MQHSTETPADSSKQQPWHLVVMVNGLWGWQRDWKMMQRYLEASNTDGRFLIHISAANTGALTYEGIDACGARLAAEIEQLAAQNPTLTTISLLGHSMGGLIARYALGLLLNPASCKVAGLKPEQFISIATPHLGCSSDHPDELTWQDRPYMRWLAAAVRGGHLGGAIAGGTAAAAAAGTAATAAGGTAAAAAAAASTAAAASHGTQPSHQQHSNSKSVNNSSSSGSSSSSSSKSWPWTPCISVIQLLGCDIWSGPAAAPGSECKPGSSSSSSSISSSNGGSIVVHACGCCRCSSSKEAASQKNNGSSSRDSSSSGDAGCCCCRDAAAAVLPTSKNGWCCTACGSGISGFTVHGSSSSNSAAAAAAVQLPLLDHMTRDVLLTCNACGALHACYFLSGLRAFKCRATYSSAGGDHLIPWTSSSLLLPGQLPTWPGHLPAAQLWTTKPVILEHPVPVLNTASEQGCSASAAAAAVHRQQQQHEDVRSSTSADLGAGRDHHQRQLLSTVPAGGAAAIMQHADGSSSGNAAAAAAAGVLSVRLLQLQSVGDWHRYHVVWPKLCLGSSHCNIQYNGGINFVGKSVLEHIVNSLVVPLPKPLPSDVQH